MKENNEELPKEFMAHICDLERHYLANDDPIKQSGDYGGPERWRREREIVLDAIGEDGDLLDAGCANGYLLRVSGGMGTGEGGCADAIRARYRPEAGRTRPEAVAGICRSLLGGERLDVAAASKVSVCLCAARFGAGEPARDVASALRESGFVVAGSAACGEYPVTRIAWVDR